MLPLFLASMAQRLLKSPASNNIFGLLEMPLLHVVLAARSISNDR
jgi:hypothetical protein